MNLRFRLGQVESVCALLLFVVVLAGCGSPEMPVPPPRESTNPAEDDFVWAMERMEHALSMFQPPSNLGLSVKRNFDYKLIPPSDSQPNYTARVTISTRATFNHAATSSARERKRAEKKRAANGLELDDPYGLPGDPVAEDELGIHVPSVELPNREVPEPNLPAQKLDEKKVYLLEYIDKRWQLQTDSLEENERMWFDYALQQDTTEEFEEQDSEEPVGAEKS